MENQLLQELQKSNRLAMATLALQARMYGLDNKDDRIELLLAAQGLTYQEIAQIVNKKPDAVRMLLARKKATKKSQKTI